MNLSARSVIVKELPQECDPRSSRLFLRELGKEIAGVIRPAVVVDCSKASKVDRRTLDLLIISLEESLKRNGDVRLAGMEQGARVVLEAGGIDRLFSHFDTVAEAKRSYGRQAYVEDGFDARSSEDERAANAA